jgi:hypothetical protein
MRFFSLDIPAVAGIEPRALDIPNGTPVILTAAGPHCGLARRRRKWHCSDRHRCSLGQEPALSLRRVGFALVARLPFVLKVLTKRNGLP